MQRWLDRLDELIFESPRDLDRNTLLAIKAGVDLVAGYFKNAGWVHDGTTVVNVNNDNRQVLAFVESLSTPMLQLMRDLSEDELEAALQFLARRRRRALLPADVLAIDSEAG